MCSGDALTLSTALSLPPFSAMLRCEAVLDGATEEQSSNGIMPLLALQASHPWWPSVEYSVGVDAVS